ncbi:MAG: tetratricopeptide repeat protein [Thermoanaerobaculia bacterium]
MKFRKLGILALAALAGALAAGCGGHAARESDRWTRAGLDALYKRHQPAEAAEDFRKALAAMPSHYGANFQLAAALEQAGRKDEAAEQWKKVAAMATAINDSGTARIALSHLAGSGLRGEDALMRDGLDALYSRHRPAEAAEDFRQVLAKNPGHYGANFQMASALEQAGRRDESRIYWMKVLVMAQGFHDEGTAKTAREHLAR